MCKLFTPCTLSLRGTCCYLYTWDRWGRHLQRLLDTIQNLMHRHCTSCGKLEFSKPSNKLIKGEAHWTFYIVISILLGSLTSQQALVLGSYTWWQIVVYILDSIDLSRLSPSIYLTLSPVAQSAPTSAGVLSPAYTSLIPQFVFPTIHSAITLVLWLPGSLYQTCFVLLDIMFSIISLHKLYRTVHLYIYMFMLCLCISVLYS